MLRIGHRIIRLAETTSTIDAARTLTDEGAEHGTVILADRQTAGRGRRGRTWTTIPGKSLAATVILRELPDADYLGLAGMAAALAVVHAVRHPDGGPDSACGAMRPLRTRWPNDVVAGGRKVAGALAELHDDALLLSLGLNINGTEADLPAELRETATTLELLVGRALDREEVSGRVLGALDGCWRVLLSSPGELVAEWQRLDLTMGEEVVVCDAKGQTRRGRAVGLDEFGRLLLREADGHVMPIAAGDVTLRA